ncbi:MAG: YDG domain-containing protein [Isosphaeraceae bacterium]
MTGVTAEGKVYDGTTAATLLVTTPGLVGVFGLDDVSLDAAGATAEFADRNAGVGKAVLVSGLTLLEADAVNYTLDATARATITPRALTVNGATAEEGLRRHDRRDRGHRRIGTRRIRHPGRRFGSL